MGIIPKEPQWDVFPQPKNDSQLNLIVSSETQRAALMNMDEHICGDPGEQVSQGEMTESRLLRHVNLFYPMLEIRYLIFPTGKEKYFEAPQIEGVHR